MGDDGTHMSKVVVSPVERFPGTVKLPDSLTFSQLLAWEQAMRQAEGNTLAAFGPVVVGALLQIVEDWHIEGLPTPVAVETFPATPVRPVSQLLGWLITEVQGIIVEAEAVPNE